NPARGHERDTDGRQRAERRARRRPQRGVRAPAASHRVEQPLDLRRPERCALSLAHTVLAASSPSATSAIAINAIAYCHRCCRSSCWRASPRTSLDPASFIRVIADWNSSALSRAGSLSRGSTLIATARGTAPALASAIATTPGRRATPFGASATEYSDACSRALPA